MSQIFCEIKLINQVSTEYLKNLKILKLCSVVAQHFSLESDISHNISILMEKEKLKITSRHK
jgi:hypothetical protein